MIRLASSLRSSRFRREKTGIQKGSVVAVEVHLLELRAHERK